MAETKRFRDTQPGNTDTRQLGVAITRIAFTPVPAEVPAEPSVEVLVEQVVAGPPVEKLAVLAPARRSLWGRLLGKVARR